MDFSSAAKAASSLVKRLQQDDSRSPLLPAAQRLSSLLLANPAAFALPDVEGSVQALLLGPATRWEGLCVGLLVCTEALRRMAPAPALSAALRAALYTTVAQHLEHDEPRVRGLVATTLGLLCTVPALGTDAYVHFQAQLWGSVEAQLARRATETRPTNLGGDKAIPLDDVTGWRSLETSLLALIAVAEGCGPELVRQGLLTRADWLDKAVFAAAAHQNRYVREAAMNTVRALVEHCGGASEETLPRQTLATVVRGGLADAWPQVVYAAVRATRSLLAESGEALFPVLLAPLCQSRYYVPEGVQVHAQETWMGLFADGSGRKVVAHNAAAMVEHHCHTVAHGRSHFARIAACYAMKEMAAKVEATAVAPLAAQLVEALLPCLKDVHWEVRSAGCVALAQVAESFPAAVADRQEDVLASCLVMLADECWSIREEAALALATLARVGGEKGAVHARLVAHLAATLEAARAQPAQTRKEQASHFNDPQAHTGRATFGCCGGLEQGHSHAYSYAAQPWEVSEGALYLFRELCAEDLQRDSSSSSSSLPSASAFADTYLPLLAELGRLQHFAEADRLRQSLWKVLPDAMLRLGKAALKRHVEGFTPALLGALASPMASPLTRHTAMACLAALSRQMGPSIFLGRLTEGERGLFLLNSSSSCTPATGNGVPQSRPSIVSM